MNKNFWIIVVIAAMAVASAARSNETGADKWGTVLSNPADEKAGESGRTSGNPVNVGFSTNITTDGANLYAVNTYDHTIQKIVISTGDVSTFAGLAGVSGASDGFGSGALFNYPQGITTDRTNLYIADTGNCVIRKVMISSGEVSTLAGTAGKCGSTDGSRLTAQFFTPYGLTAAGTSLYVVQNNNGAIRKIDISDGVVTTLVNGFISGRETDEDLTHPTAIAADEINLYVVDHDGKRIRKVVIETGKVSTLAGRPGVLGSVDGIGPTARFGAANGVTTDGVNLYVADTYNGTIRKIVISTGKVVSLAGAAGQFGFADGAGQKARFNLVSGITINGNSLYVVNNGNKTIRKVATMTGAVETLLVSN